MSVYKTKRLEELNYGSVFKFNDYHYEKLEWKDVCLVLCSNINKGGKEVLSTDLMVDYWPDAKKYINT